MARKLSLYRIKKAIAYFRHYGPREFYYFLKERFQSENVEYESWYQQHRPSEDVLKVQQKTHFFYEPLISIVVPVYNTPVIYLEKMIQSVRQQTYENWELCIANADPADQEVGAVLTAFAESDARIKIVNLSKNQGIAQNTNAALAVASGAYVGFLDHDDVLSLDALYEVVKRINENERNEVIYSDEDKITEDKTRHFQPHFKPELNLDLLRANNYICHFCVIKKTLIDEVGGLRSAFNGAQDYDLILRCVEKASGVTRIPKILYHWRVHQASTADNPASKSYAYEAGKRAIEEHLQRCEENATVFHTKDFGFYRVKYDLQGSPKVSVLIPNKDHIQDLEKCLKSMERSTYKNYEIIIIENNSTEKATFDYYEKIASEQIKIIKWEGSFNYSAINNYGVRYASGEYFLLLNNDVEAIGVDWIQEMLATCQRREVGVVGAKLYYPNDTVQHAGVILGIGGVAGHAFIGLPREYSGYMHKASLQQNLSAVTAACMMVKRSVYEAVGGFTEELAVAFGDVDFCLKVRELGYLVAYDPYVELYHYESKTRGPEDTKEKLCRFQDEIDYMKSRWPGILEEGDPMYNPNLTLKKWDYSLRK